MVDLGAEVKSTSSLINPNRIPKELTVEDIFVIWRGAENGFANSTVTWLILFSLPVVDRTVWYSAQVVEEGNREHPLSSAAELRRLVFNAGSVTSRARDLNACTKDAILVLPSKPEIVSWTSRKGVNHILLSRKRALVSLTLLADEIVECLSSLWAIICLQKKFIET